MRNYNTDEAVKVEAKRKVDELFAFCKQHNLPLVAAINYGATKRYDETGKFIGISHDRQVVKALVSADRCPPDLEIAYGFIEGIDSGMRATDKYLTMSAFLSPAGMLADQFAEVCAVVREGGPDAEHETMAKVSEMLAKEGIDI